MEMPIAMLSRNERGYTKEINLISWNGLIRSMTSEKWHPGRERILENDD